MTFSRRERAELERYIGRYMIWHRGGWRSPNRERVKVVAVTLGRVQVECDDGTLHYVNDMHLQPFRQV